MSFLDTIQSDVSTAWQDVTSTGVPAVIAGVENYASQQLAGQANANQAAAQTAANQVAASSGASSGIMKSVQSAITSVASGALIKQYGWQILAGGFVLYIVFKKI